ncbi:MAG TPA: hypothetical protein EYN79_03760 [Planctomycetes bacterium]|nr:hypothetical protein [Planctomycetota bacterium]HIN80937.1 hypothetical protein [Planctomycetota bacterium]
MLKFIILTGLLMAAPTLTVDEPKDVASIPTEERFAGGDKDQRYFLHGPIGSTKAPKRGFSLLVVLPGGGGGDDFRGFVENIAKNGAGAGWLTAQLVAKKWNAEQKIVWPHKKNTPVAKQRFTTEEFIDRVIADVARKTKIDPHRVVLFGWSSSGPALYAHALRKRTPVSRYFVAMSVFKPKYLPSIKLAKGKSFFLYHSPDDQVCRFGDAKRAKKDLAAAGARVEILEYEGGHGWRGNVFGNIKKGIKWLFAEAAS